MKSLQWISATLCLLLAPALAGAQTQNADGTGIPRSGGIVAGVGILTTQRGVQNFQGVKGAPYSAAIANELDRVLADGNRIHTENHGKVFRDGEGRTRNEQEWGNAATGSRRTHIWIFDPVQGLSISIDPQTKTANVNHLKVPSPPPVDPVPAPVRARSKLPFTLTTEELGSKEIEGVVAVGVRRTETYEAGSVGNEKPFSVISETWRSRDLNIVLLSTRDDPRTGQHTTRLTNLQTSEPDPLFFQVPSDYTVREHQNF